MGTAGATASGKTSFVSCLPAKTGKASGSHQTCGTNMLTELLPDFKYVPNGCMIKVSNM